MHRAEATAEIIGAARCQLASLQSPAPAIAPCDEKKAYSGQDALHWLPFTSSGSLVGYKVGCNSPVIKRYGSCSGPANTADCHASGEVLRSQDRLRLGVGLEIASLPRRRCSHRRLTYAAATISHLIEKHLPAIELVDDRLWTDVGPVRHCRLLFCCWRPGATSPIIRSVRFGCCGRSRRRQGIGGRRRQPSGRDWSFAQCACLAGRRWRQDSSKGGKSL